MTIDKNRSMLAFFAIPRRAPHYIRRSGSSVIGDIVIDRIRWPKERKSSMQVNYLNSELVFFTIAKLPDSVRQYETINPR